MYNLIDYEYRDNYSKTLRSLWQYCRDEPFLDDNGPIADFPAYDNNSPSFKFKTNIADRTGNDGTKDVKISVPLKYFSNFCVTLKMSLINYEINLIPSKHSS